MNIYNNLIKDLKCKLKLENKNVENFIFRISANSDLERVKNLGSSRLGISKNLWSLQNKLDNTTLVKLKKLPIYHHDIIIASYWEDLENDSLLENGTLKHKLEIYEYPFFTIYEKNKLYKLLKEDNVSENNQGTHFYFLTEPLKSLDSLWQIENKESKFFVNKIDF